MEPAVSRCKRANYAVHAIRMAAGNARIAEAPEASMRKAILSFLKEKRRLKEVLLISDAQKSINVQCPTLNVQFSREIPLHEHLRIGNRALDIGHLCFLLKDREECFWR
jgi:hypothetical protein